MLKTLGKFLLTLVVVLAILAAGGWYVLTQTDLGRGAATDALWNSGIVTSQIESALRGNEDAIAARLGVSAE